MVFFFFLFQSPKPPKVNLERTYEPRRNKRDRGQAA